MDKGFFARPHQVLLYDNDVFTWSWAAEWGEHDGPSRAVLEYGYVHDIPDLTPAQIMPPSSKECEIERCASILGAAISDCPLSYTVKNETPVLLDVLTENAAKDLVGVVPTSYIDIPVVAPTYDDVAPAFYHLFTGQFPSSDFRSDRDRLRQQLHYLFKRTGSKCEDQGDTTTFSRAPPPQDENGYRSYDRDNESNESNEPKFVFTFTDRGFSFTEKQPNRYYGA